MVFRTILLALACLPALASGAPLLKSVGIARAVDDGRTIYREVHWQVGDEDGSARLVLYLCPDGQPFARKWMPASERAPVRGFTLDDRRSGQVATVDVLPDAIAIDWKEEASSPPRRKRLPLDPTAVVDAGFDAAVREHWPRLMSGESVKLQFLVPGRQRWFPVQVQRVRALAWQGVPAQAIRVTLNAWYGFAVPPLNLVYADADRRLLEFRGTSNLRDSQGDYPQVSVRFPTPAVPGNAAQWQQDRSRPLVTRCAGDPEP